MANPVLGAGVAAFFVVLAVVVLATRPASRLNQAFAALLAVRAVTTFEFEALRAAADVAAAAVHAHRLVWFTIPVPFFTAALLHELVAPPRIKRWTGAGVLALGAGTALFFAVYAATPTAFIAAVGRLAGTGPFSFTSGPWYYSLPVATALISGYAVVHAASRAGDVAASAVARRQAALVGLGFLFIVAHAGAWFALLVAVRPGGPFATGNLAATATAVPAVVAMVAAAFVAPRLVSAFDGRARAAATAAAVVPFVWGAWDGVLVPLARLGATPFPGYDNGVLPMRAAFAAAVALALVRYGLAGFGARGRERLATVAVAAFALALAALVAGAALAVAGVTTTGLVLAPVLAGAALLLSPGPLRGVVRRVTERVLMDPQSAAAAAERARTYAAALRPALTPDGTVAPEAAATLRRLREALDIGDREHALLVTAVAAGAFAADEETLLGRYRMDRELGRGAFGSAWLATDPLTGEHVVLKRFHAKQAVAKAKKEARALAAVSHPNVVPLLDVDHVGDEVFLVLGYVPGGTARALLDDGGPVPVARAVAIVADVLDGLAALHAADIVHRDVKLENILLSADGRAVLGDFGSARFTTVDATTTGAAAAGSLATMAPETLRRGEAYPASDVYSAAAVLFRLLTGTHYVDLDDVDAFTARERILMDAPRLDHAGVPVTLRDALGQALAKRPDDRPASAAAWKQVVQEAASAA